MRKGWGEENKTPSFMLRYSDLFIFFKKDVLLRISGKVSDFYGDITIMNGTFISMK